MMLPPPEFVPDSVLERRALKLLQEHEQTSGAAVTIPVPVELIAERTLGLQLIWLEIEDQPGDVILARVDPDYYGRPTIQMNQRHADHFEQYFGTDAYSVGHECGHWTLHYDRGNSTQPMLPGLLTEPRGAPIVCRRLSSHDRRELQAERFAAYLLMPAHLILPLLTGRHLNRPSEIADLARTCGVSKRALARRLAELGRIVLAPDGRITLPTSDLGMPRLV